MNNLRYDVYLCSSDTYHAQLMILPWIRVPYNNFIVVVKNNEDHWPRKFDIAIPANVKNLFNVQWHEMLRVVSIRIFVQLPLHDSKYLLKTKPTKINRVDIQTKQPSPFTMDVING